MSLSVAMLAGGLATRLRPVTETIPKALVEVADKPFAAHQLELLQRQEVRDVVWLVGYRADQIEAVLGDGSRWDMNFGHLFFTRLFNVVYGTRLRDPFTMYKVFRRECLSGLTFESNRFDFDWELVGKLVRAGYLPLEIPVNYSSRSFSEGKKVSFWRDPLTWIRACLKYRFQALGK